MFKRLPSSIFVLSLWMLWPTLIYAQIEEQMEKTSIVEEIRKELETRKTGLSPFGYDLFNLEPTAFQPDTLYGPVDPGYPVGPGDEVIVNVWGQVEFTYSALINREGYIAIPKVGPILANGLTLRELQKRVMDRLSRAYSGISRDPTRATTFVDVSLGRLKPLRVFIIGEVSRPGGYTVSSVSTVLNALYRAGGPHVRGSLRAIQVIRRGRVVATVDLYDYLLRGDTSREVRLQNDDTILVPPIGKTVSLAGRVHRPAVYELKSEEGLKELLDIAGGVEPDAYLGRIQIDRIVPHREREVIDVDFAKVLESGEDVELFDGDGVSISLILDRRENVVKLRGFVKRPGIYQLREGWTVKDLIQEAHGLWEEAFLGRADIIRTNPDLTKDIIPFHLGKALDGDEKENLKLERLDEVVVHSIHTFKERESVTILGSVRHPGEYELLSDMTLEDLIVLAGGLTETAYKLRAELSRVDPEQVSPDKPAEIIYVDISDDYTASGEGRGFKLQNFDAVFIRPNPDWEKQRNVTISGEVRFPGTYTLKSGAERLSSIIERAGGLKETAYPEGIVLMRQTGTGVDTLTVQPRQRIAVELKKALEHRNDKYDIVLFDGDSITIPRRPETVRVSGEVLFPSIVPYVRGEGIGYYLDRAGGLKETADKRRIRIVLANGRVEKPRRFWFDPKITPGSTIFVPAKEKSTAEWHSTVKHALTILSGAAVAIVAIDRLTH